MEVILGKERRRWSDEEKRALVAETFGDGETVNRVARRHSINPSMLFVWRKQYREELCSPTAKSVTAAAPHSRDLHAEAGFVPVAIAPPAPGTPSAGPPGSHPVIELNFGRGASMRISGAADPGLAVAVMKAMRRR